MDAHHRADAAALVALMREDVRFTMPPQPAHYEGIAEVGAFMHRTLGVVGEFRMVPTRANRMPAVANYLKAPGDTEFRALALDVLRVEDGQLVIAGQIALIALLATVSIHLSRLLHDAVPSAMRTGVASGVSTLSWLTFLPSSLAFGAVSGAADVRAGGWIVVVLVAVAGAALLRLSRPVLDVSPLSAVAG